jgi:outer membrane protein OmpA-like peptidoglycan-associated protein
MWGTPLGVLVWRPRGMRRTCVCLLLLVCSGCQSYSIGATEYGTLGGAAAGAGLGAIIGHQTGNAGVGVAIGSAAGAIGGALIGAQIEQTDRAIDERQRRIDAHDQMIAENARLLEELRQRGVDVRDTDRGVVVNLPDILFESGRSELTSPAQTTVREIAGVIKEGSQRRIAVEGHTDSLGTIEYNHRLSEARARRVADELEASGISGRLLTTHAFGETTPIASNRTEQGRRRNRRVEVIIENR